MQVKKQWLELDMEQLTGSKLGLEYDKDIYCHPLYLTYKQSTSCEMLGWMNYKLELKIPGKNINNFRYAYNTTLMAESKEELCGSKKRKRERRFFTCQKPGSNQNVLQ